jgi:phosphatidylglycerol:prolipoprotein diacylglycerol transferase
VYPTLIEWPITISTFGVMLAVGFLVAGELLARDYVSRGLERDEAWSFVFWAAVGGIAGAKLWYVAEQLARGEPGELSSFLFSRGGLTWYGGLAGGALAGALATRRAGRRVAAAADAVAAPAAIGQALGRIGCFLVGDDYGRPTGSWLGVAFPRGLPPTEVPVHPTQLYEAAWLALVGAWLLARRSRSPSSFAEYLLLAGSGRLAIEVLRVNPAALGPLSNAQLVALACIALGAVICLRHWIRPPAPAPAPPSTARR